MPGKKKISPARARAILFFTFYLQLCFQRAISQIILPRAHLQHDVLLIRREDLIKLSSLFFSERYYYSQTLFVSPNFPRRSCTPRYNAKYSIITLIR